MVLRVGRRARRPRDAGRRRHSDVLRRAVSTETKPSTSRQRLGSPLPSRQRIRKRSRPDQRHHAGDGLHDRLGHLYCFRRNCARDRLAGAADRGLAGDRLYDHRRRSQLWRAGGHDAAGRRAIRLPAGSAGAAVGISLWLDAFSGHPDRDHCGGRRGLRQVSRHLLSLHFFLELDPAFLEGSADSHRPDGAGQHGCRAEHAEPGRDPGRGCRCR